MSGGQNKVVLKRSDAKWLKENYVNIPNCKILEHLGISRGVLNRLIKEYHLRKSPEYLKEINKESLRLATKAAKEKGWPPKGYIIPKSEEARKKGQEKMAEMRADEEINARWRKNMSIGRKKLYRDEKRRVLFGLEQKSKIKVIRASHAKVCCRTELRSLGYIVGRGSNVAYWNADTLRNEEREKNASRYGIRFEPLSEAQ